MLITDTTSFIFLKGLEIGNKYFKLKKLFHPSSAVISGASI
jgi:hypothetical protein